MYQIRPHTLDNPREIFAQLRKRPPNSIPASNAPIHPPHADAATNTSNPAAITAGKVESIDRSPPNSVGYSQRISNRGIIKAAAQRPRLSCIPLRWVIVYRAATATPALGPGVFDSDFTP